MLKERENNGLRKTFQGLRRRTQQEIGHNCTVRSFTLCTLHHIHIIRVIKTSKEMGAARVMYGEKRHTNRVFVCRRQGSSPLGNLRRR
jgi:hypothetical protein